MAARPMILCCALLAVLACDDPLESPPAPVDVAGDWVFEAETTYLSGSCEALGFLEGHWVIVQDGHSLEFLRGGTGEPRSGYIAGHSLHLSYRLETPEFIVTEKYSLQVSDDLQSMAGTLHCRSVSWYSSCEKEADVTGTRGAPGPSEGASQGGACRIQILSIEEDELRVLSDTLIRTWE